MAGASFFNLKAFFKSHALIIRIALLTGFGIILFQIISLFVIYRYLKLDYYLCLVAAIFLTLGVLLRKNAERQSIPIVPRNNSLVLLSARELKVLEMIAQGKSNKEIASFFFIELSTVKTHVNNIYTKLSIRNRNEARVKYLEMSRNIVLY